MSNCPAQAYGASVGYGVGGGALMILALGIAATNPFTSLMVLTSGMQTFNTAFSGKKQMESEIENQKNICSQINLIDEKQKIIDQLINKVKSAQLIDKNTQDEINNLTELFFIQKKQLKEQRGDYKRNLSVFAIINIVVLFYLYNILYIK